MGLSHMTSHEELVLGLGVRRNRPAEVQQVVHEEPVNLGLGDLLHSFTIVT